jgi:DNA mismatch endonuclease (patch repair protein)
MADFLSKEKRSKLMASIKSRANKDTELCLMAILRANRIRGWRRNAKIFGKPDFVFHKHRIAVFVDGCFWHGCHFHGHRPATNSDFWVTKLVRIKARDRHVTARLKKQGWHVIRIWEHSLKNPEQTIARLKNEFSTSCRL